jgi:hypothetical protein
VVETASPSTLCWRSSSRMTTQPTTGSRFCWPATISFSSAQVFEEEKRAVPYFNHKQLSYSFLPAGKATGKVTSSQYNSDYAYVRSSKASLSHLPPGPESSQHWFVVQIGSLV